MKAVLLTMMLLAPQAWATCVPANLGGPGSQLVYSENGKGCWVGWWCPVPAADPQRPATYSPYVAVAVKSKCGLVGTRREFWAWVKSPDKDKLTFGADPWTDPGLRAVWFHEKAKLDAVKPK